MTRGHFAQTRTGRLGRKNPVLLDRGAHFACMRRTHRTTAVKIKPVCFRVFRSSERASKRIGGGDDMIKSIGRSRFNELSDARCPRRITAPNTHLNVNTSESNLYWSVLPKRSTSSPRVCASGKRFWAGSSSSQQLPIRPPQSPYLIGQHCGRLCSSLARSSSQSLGKNPSLSKCFRRRRARRRRLVGGNNVRVGRGGQKTTTTTATTSRQLATPDWRRRRPRETDGLAGRQTGN